MTFHDEPSNPAHPSRGFTIKIQGAQLGSRLPHALVRAGLIFSDVAVLLIAAILANLLRFGNPLAIDRPALVVMAALPMMILASELFGLYQPSRASQHVRSPLRWAGTWSVTLGLMLVVLFFTKTGNVFSRLWVAYWYIAALLMILPVRFIWAHALHGWYRKGRMGENVGVVGSSEELEGFLKATQSRLRSSVMFHDHREDPAEALPQAVFDRIGHLYLLILTFDARNEKRIESWLGPCRNLNIAVDLAPPLSRELAHLEPHDLGGLMVWRMSTAPMSGDALMLKRLEDIVLGALSLLVALPVMALVALAIRIDSPGPILFRQRRHGFNGREFTVLKFRSMTAAPQDDRHVPQAVRDDPRITRVGAFIRRTSLDELPQIINVLRGDMSMVGPRPHAVAHNEAFGKQIEDYLRRHRVKPGITGWAQVNGYRGETDTLDKMERRIEFDLYYIDNWSLGLDLRILLRTLAVIIHPNAY
jgi:Undecaprenyl-phosphate glucose phosphotransferase